jgi:hypothetical protein
MMQIPGTQFKVSEVVFESNDPEVVVRGNMSKGVMNYDTEIIISHTQLNQIVNQLQKVNETTAVSELFKVEKMYDGEQMFSANFTQLNHNQIDLGYISNNTMLKQIRA